MADISNRYIRIVRNIWTPRKSTNVIALKSSGQQDRSYRKDAIMYLRKNRLNNIAKQKDLECSWLSEIRQDLELLEASKPIKAKVISFYKGFIK